MPERVTLPVEVVEQAKDWIYRMAFGLDNGEEWAEAKRILAALAAPDSAGPEPWSDTSPATGEWRELRVPGFAGPSEWDGGEYVIRERKGEITVDWEKRNLRGDHMAFPTLTIARSVAAALLAACDEEPR